MSQEAFGARLGALLDLRNRGRLAALRRGLGRPVGTPPDAAREFYRILPVGIDQRNEHAYWTAATLFAAYPPREDVRVAVGASVATALRRLADQDGAGEEAVQRVERRLLPLLNARRGVLDVHLRGIASLLHSEGIALDASQLARDLSWWDAPARPVQRRWARDFWRAPTATTETEEVA